MDSVQKALAELSRGRMVVLVDEHREAEGDLVMAAQMATPRDLSFMLREARGFICLTLRESRRRQLAIARMTEHNTEHFGTPFCVSVGAKNGGSGTSVFDRLAAARVVMDPKSKPGDLTVPGHLHLLSAANDGITARLGHTEGAADLVEWAGLAPYAFVCEIMNDDGSMADKKQLAAFAKRHELVRVSLADVKSHAQKVTTSKSRNSTAASPCVTCVSKAELPTAFGTFQVHAYHDEEEQKTHLALVKRPQNEPVRVRLHSKCVTGDALFSARCDCGPQLEAAYRTIAQTGGIILYLDQEGRGIGLENKIRAYALQDTGLDTVEANHQLGLPDDARAYDAAACMLKDLGATRVCLLTNNPAKVRGLQKSGIVVEKREPLEIAATPTTKKYLSTKKNKMQHQLEGV
ncbi:MAG: GTP cyclohydrolase II [Candidatus Micrarchaeota archaeon]|nr:GTP cyclohydrolase II [Candidatus Micrarchaeota archaeon]